MLGRRSIFTGILILGLVPFSLAQEIQYDSGYSWRAYVGTTSPTCPDRLCHYNPMVSWDSHYREFAAWKSLNGDPNSAHAFMNFRVIFPPGYNFADTVTKYPAILMLHGAGESGRVWTGRFNYSDTDPRYDNNSHNLLHGGNEHRLAVNKPPSDPTSFPGFVIFPQASYSGSWGDAASSELNENEEFLVGFLETQMVARYHVDINRIGVHGLSNGAKGTWTLAQHRPDLFAAIHPMSGIPLDFDQASTILLTTAVRISQGGNDLNPSPGATQGVINAFLAKGGNPQLFYYPTLGHGTWVTTYAEPDFFSWFLSKDIRKIYVFGGDPSICAGGTLRLGFPDNMVSYQWMRNGVEIPGENTRYLDVTEPDTYSVVFQRPNGEIAESFPLDVVPRTVSDNSPEITHIGSVTLPITQNNGTSLGSVQNTVTITAPPGHSEYHWYKDDVFITTTSPNPGTGALGNTRTVSINAGAEADAGIYTVRVTEATGCVSEDSNPITLTYVAGGVHTQPGIPTGTGSGGRPTITVLSATEARVDWLESIANETGFEIWRVRRHGSNYGEPYKNEAYRMVGTVPPNTTTFTDKSLRPSAQYAYRVRAIGGGDGMFSLETTFGSMQNDFVPPTPPSNLVVTDIERTEITVSWDPAADNDVVYQYEVFLGSQLRKIVWVDSLNTGILDPTDGNPAPPTSYTITGLDPATTYLISVRTVDFRNNRSTFAEPVTATTLTIGGSTASTGLYRRVYTYTGSLPTTPAGTNKVQDVDFSALTPASASFITQFAQSGSGDRFMNVIEGYLQVNVTGTYTFRLNSDEGSVLYIEDVKIVDHDGLHTASNKDVQHTFTSTGLYEIRVLYFDHSGSNSLTVQYDLPGGSLSFASINTGLLFRPTVTPITNYFSKSSGNLNSTSNWGTSASGSGSQPPNFTTAGQVFNIANRTSVTLSSPMTVSGQGSRMVVGTNIALTLDDAFTGRLEAAAGATIDLNHATIPNFGMLAATSTVNMNVGGTIPSASYGNLNFNTASTVKQLALNSIIARGHVVVQNDVDVIGASAPVANQSRLLVGGNLTFQGNSGAAPSPDDLLYAVSFTGGLTHTITLNQFDARFYELRTDFGDIVNFNFGSSDPFEIIIGRPGAGGGMSLASGSVLNVGANNLTVYGSTGINSNNETGVVHIDGGNLLVSSHSEINSNLGFGESQNKVTDLSVTLAGDGELNLSNMLELKNLMSLSGRLNTFGNLTLLSNDEGTARIGPLASTTRINGDITVQRFMENNGRIYRYISSPVKGAKVADLQEFMPITGNFVGASTGPGLTSNPSMFYFVENGGGYLSFPPNGGTNQDTLRMGRGYSPFIREEFVPTTWAVTGVPNQGTMTFNLTPDTGASTDGWNLVGNPYPAPIQWTGSSSGGWTLSGVGNTISIRENWNGGFGYRWFNGSAGNFDGVIAPGQAFWVQTTSASPSMVLAETAKQTVDGTFYREGEPENTLEIVMRSPTLEDATFIQLVAGAHPVYEKHLDAVKQSNSFFNLSSLTSDGQRVAINLTSPDACGHTILLRIDNVAIGNYDLTVSGAGSITSGDRVTLIDSFLNTETDVTSSVTYPFAITANIASKADGRFKIRFVKPNVDLGLSLSSEAACEQNDPVILIENSQPGVNYFAQLDGTTISSVAVGTGGLLELSVNHDLIGYGKFDASVMAGFANCSQTLLYETVKVKRDTLAIPVLTMNEGILMTNLDGNSYKWYLDGEELIGETANQMDPEHPGEYTVQVTSGSCSKLSDSFLKLAIDTGILFTSVTACDQDPKVLIANSQPGVQYRAYYEGNEVSGIVLGTGSEIFLSVDRTLISHGVNEILVHGWFPNDEHVIIPQAISVTQDFLPTPVISVSGTKLIASATGSQYKWYLNGTLLEGMNDREIEIPQEGVFTVEVTSGECMKMSNALPFTFTINVDLALSSIPACEESDPVVRIENSQPGVEYAAYHGQAKVSSNHVGNGNTLEILIDRNLIELGETELVVRAGYANSQQHTLIHTINVNRQSLKTPVIIASSVLLMADIEGAQYKWFLNGEELAGVTTRGIEPTESGSYAVEVSVASCVRRSGVVDFIVTGVEDERVERLYPNPARDRVIVILARPVDLSSIRATTLLGQTTSLPARRLTERSAEVDLGELGSGLYLLYVNDRHFKVVKE